MMANLRTDLASIVERFVRDYVARIRRAPLRELQEWLATAPPSAERRPPTSDVSAKLKAWTAQYGLTEAEASVLEATVRGKNRPAIARERGVRSATIKAQVHSMLRKTRDKSVLAAAGRLLRED
jgi:DNA-binding NarL/FixJ family response regulator